MHRLGYWPLLAILTLTLSACATKTAATADESSGANDRVAAEVDYSEDQLILVNSDIKFVHEKFVEKLTDSRFDRKWSRAKKRGEPVRVAFYPPIVRSDQKLAGMISSLFTRIEEDLVANYDVDIASSIAFRGAEEPEGNRVVTDDKLRQARDMEVDYLVTGIIGADRAEGAAIYDFELRIVEVESGNVALDDRTTIEKP